MCTEHARLLGLWVEADLDLLGPDAAGGTHFCNLHVEVHAHAPEERQAGRKFINIQTRVDACGQKKGQAWQ